MAVIHGDCHDVLPTLEDESFDCLVTDPPFGIGKTYDGKQEVASSPEEYWAWLKPIYDMALAKVRPGGFVAVWQTQRYFRHFWDWFGPDIHIYVAAKNFVQMRPTPINYAYDPVVMFYKPGAEALRPAKPRRNVDFYVANTASLVSDPSRPERAHPFPRPVEAVKEILSNLSTGRVLDPFLGSGTTAVAAQSLGRDCVGIEVNEQYCDIARKRIRALTTMEDFL